MNTTYLYARGRWACPASHLPGPTAPAVAVRFCPVPFAMRPRGDAAAPPTPGVAAGEGAASAGMPFELPYRLVFAVASTDTLFVYDTAEATPVALVAGLHFASITDLAWSPDGRFLAVSSSDGYCSLIAFEEGELGEPAPADAVPANVARRLQAAAVEAVRTNHRPADPAPESERPQEGEPGPKRARLDGGAPPVEAAA